MPARRVLLRRLCALGGVAVAGCAERTRPESPASATPTPTQSPTDRPTATNTASPTDTLRPRLTFGEADADGVRPLDARVDPSYRRIRATDHNAIVAPPSWFLFVTVERETGEPRPRSIWLETAGDTYQPLAVRDDDHARRVILSVEGAPYGDRDRGWLLFEIPYDDSIRDPVLRRNGAAWPLPASAVARLRAEPPAFELQSLSTPERAPADEPFDATVTVRNDGGAGVFRSAFNFRQPIYIPSGASWPVEAGTTATLTATLDIHSGYVTSDPGDTVEGQFVSAGGAADFSVELT